METFQGFPVSGEQAERAVATEQRKMNNGRTLPKIPKAIQELSEATKVWIYNVGPFGFKQELGSAGTWFVPKCEPGDSYAVMRPVPGVFGEYIIKDEKNFEYRHEDGASEHGGSSGGRYIAEQILGVGMHLPPSEALTKWGCFIGSEVGPNAAPTESELTGAQVALDKTANELVREGDLAYQKGPDEAKAVITDKHHWAASYLNLNGKEHLWMRTNPSASMRPQVCPVDGTAVDAGVILCPTCRYIFDEKKYAEIKSRIAK